MLSEIYFKKPSTLLTPGGELKNAHNHRLIRAQGEADLKFKFKHANLESFPHQLGEIQNFGKRIYQLSAKYIAVQGSNSKECLESQSNMRCDCDFLHVKARKYFFYYAKAQNQFF